MSANGTLMSTGITVTGPLAAAAEIAVRVAFVDDRGNAGSAHRQFATVIIIREVPDRTC